MICSIPACSGQRRGAVAHRGAGCQRLHGRGGGAAAVAAPQLQGHGADWRDAGRQGGLPPLPPAQPATFTGSAEQTRAADVGRYNPLKDHVLPAAPALLFTEGHYRLYEDAGDTVNPLSHRNCPDPAILTGLEHA